MVEGWEEYDEELDRALAYWQRSAEYKGGGRPEAVRFFQQKTLDEMFEDVKADFAARGGDVMGKPPSEARASMQEYMTKGVHRSLKLYKARVRFARAMFLRAAEKAKEKDAWDTIRDYLKEGK
jgi:hypothetical protein